MLLKRILPAFSLVIGMTAVAPAHSTQEEWIIRKDSWSATDERNFSNFITALGESGCKTVDSCMKSTANPYRSTDPARHFFWGDCAKFPYLLRAYFAWKNGLPFSYTRGVTAADGQNKDLRYSPKGNLPTARRDIVYNGARSGKNERALDILKRMLLEVNTAMFRYHPDVDIRSNGAFFDFYPAQISRGGVRPGTLIYDANGHVAIVYKVEPDGRVRFLDSHPDNTVTRGVYGEKFARSSPGMGAGFKNFRPIRLVGAEKDRSGALTGGRITTVPYTQIPDYSTEQYFGTQPAATWKAGKFVHNGTTLSYYDFVRTRLAIGELKYHPVEEMVNGIDALCQDIHDRIGAVQAAISAGINNKSHPSRLPENIYGTHGEWETYSTPSRDARLKTSFRELRTSVEQFIELYRQGSPRVEYQGTNLVADLREAYDRAARACTIEYARTDGSKVRLNFDDITERLYDLSFDPYHCVELRWGARETSELSTCPDRSEKLDWYAAERGLRNQLERTYDAKMGFTLDQLKSGGPGTGVTLAPEVNLRRYLERL